MNHLAAENGGEANRQKAALGMWTFLASEALFFGALIMGFLVYRRAYAVGFAAASDELDVMLGGLNTFLLLTSSLGMAAAVILCREGRNRAARVLLLATAALGVAFLAIKGVEYSREIGHGLAPWRPDAFPGSREMELFFNFYFAMTGLHALHLAIGIVAVLAASAMPGRRGDHAAARLRATGLYWHFVDIVWVFLFPLLYLIR